MTRTSPKRHWTKPLHRQILKPVEAKRSAKVESETIENTKGQETFEEGVVDTKHVNDGDNPAVSQTDETKRVKHLMEESIQRRYRLMDPSAEINERNRYTTIDNAQTRTL